jgi:hypothetical protein
LFDLDLPGVGPGEEPIELSPPSFKAMMDHARFLLASQPADFFEERLAAMNPEPFRLD